MRKYPRKKSKMPAQPKTPENVPGTLRPRTSTLEERIAAREYPYGRTDTSDPANHPAIVQYHRNALKDLKRWEELNGK